MKPETLPLIDTDNTDQDLVIEKRNNNKNLTADLRG
jgi:hypothetical protein